MRSLPKRRKKAASPTKSATQIVKILVYFYITNNLLLICPSKWNKTTQRFEYDSSGFLTTFRFVHITARCLAVLTCLIYLIFLSAYLTYVDLFVFIGGGLMLSSSISLQLFIWKSPDTFATVFNALIQLNRNCVKEDNPDQQLILRNAQANLQQFMAMLSLGCFITPFFWLAFLRSNTSMILIHLTSISTFLFDIPEIKVHVVYSILISILMYSDMLLWNVLVICFLLYAAWGQACLRGLDWNQTCLVEKDIKRYQLSFRQLQLVFGALNRRMCNTRAWLVFTFFERAACAFFVFFSIKIIQQHGERDTFYFVAPAANLIFSGFTTYLHFRLVDIFWSVTLESIEFRKSFLAQKLRYNKQQLLFIKSCPPFQLILGGCLPYNNEQPLLFTNDYTLNLMLTLLLSYR